MWVNVERQMNFGIVCREKSAIFHTNFVESIKNALQGRVCESRMPFSIAFDDSRAIAIVPRAKITSFARQVHISLLSRSGQRILCGPRLESIRSGRSNRCFSSARFRLRPSLCNAMHFSANTPFFYALR